uniref:Cytochrome b5 heme-binding domain-containing protein n=1 Tax=Nelumbo nucifera TaxID=4432 RepID=A0A822YJ23_NELNU|nr:TPA_asm: hypothetical protein HUJ06_010362 [Nelumbo nucifera]
MPTITRIYTLQQAAEHNKRDDCWVVIDGKVYPTHHKYLSLSLSLSVSLCACVYAYRKMLVYRSCSS